MLRCQSSESLSFIPDKSVDAVITDPPYFDNVQYSELADFFYVWLRLGLKDDYPWFEPQLSSRRDEIVKNVALGKTTEFFQEALQRVLVECHRVLKDDALLVFTFHHNKTWAWKAIAELLLDAGFYVSATPIVRSEGKSGFHSSKGNIRYDCVLVSRKRPSPRTDGDWSSLADSVLEDATSWARRTVESRMPINKVDVFAIVMGKAIEHYTKRACNDWDRGQVANLGDYLNDLKTVSDRIRVNEVGTGDQRLEVYPDAVRQLKLLVMESRAMYDTKTPKRQESDSVAPPESQ